MQKKVSKQLFYDSIATEWESFMNMYDLQRRLELIYDQLLRDVPLKGKRLLDGGCGTGWFSKWAKDRGAEVLSLDISEKLVDFVRQRFGTQAEVGDVLQLKYADNSFDVVVSSEVIEHTPDPEKAVAEYARVLKPGGVLALTCPNYSWYWSCYLANLIGIRRYKGIENWPSWWQLKSYAHKAGLTIEKQRGLHLFPFVIGPLNPLLKLFDLFGGLLGPLYVNQALRARKP